MSSVSDPNKDGYPNTWRGLFEFVVLVLVFIGLIVCYAIAVALCSGAETVYPNGMDPNVFQPHFSTGPMGEFYLYGPVEFFSTFTDGIHADMVGCL